MFILYFDKIWCLVVLIVTRVTRYLPTRGRVGTAVLSERTICRKDTSLMKKWS